MRPRVFPAEDAVPLVKPVSRVNGFNEAAGIPRGRLTEPGGAVPAVEASMRPRVFPAEDFL